MLDDYVIKVFKNKIKFQIANHQREMNKKNKQFDFYEGRKIEAELILKWFEEVTEE